MTPRSLIAPARLARRPVLATQTDERLVDLAGAGSGPAFEAIVARYRRPLLRYCARLLSQERAEDAVQQALVNAYASLREGIERRRTGTSVAPVPTAAAPHPGAGAGRADHAARTQPTERRRRAPEQLSVASHQPAPGPDGQQPPAVGDGAQQPPH